MEVLSRDRNQRYRRCIIKTGSMSWPLMLLKVFPQLNMWTRLHSWFVDLIQYCVDLLLQLSLCILCNSSLSWKCNLGNTNWGHYMDTYILKSWKALVSYISVVWFTWHVSALANMLYFLCIKPLIWFNKCGAMNLYCNVTMSNATKMFTLLLKKAKCVYIRFSLCMCKIKYPNDHDFLRSSPYHNRKFLSQNYFSVTHQNHPKSNVEM